MRVLIDTLSCGNRVYGVGRVLLEHLNRLAVPARSNLELFLIVSEDNRALFDIPGATPILFPAKLRMRALSLPIQILWERLALPGIIRRLGIDVYLRPNLSWPASLPCPQTVFIHDLAEFHPEGRLQYSFLRRMYRRRAVAANVRRADHVLTISRHAAEELLERFPALEGRLTVILNGAPPEVLRENQEGRGNAGHGRCFLSVGKLLRHKNHITLCRAYVKADRARRLSLPLVFLGGDGNAAAELKEFVAREGYADRILFAGYVSDAEVEAWYGRAAAFMFPTLYEGFGLPILESMARGVPVVTSNAACLPEVAGEAALLLDPHREEDWAKAFADIDAGKLDLGAMAKDGYARARSFSWDEASAELARILESSARAAGRRGSTDAGAKRVTMPKAAEEIK